MFSVERVTVIARFMDSTPLKTDKVLQAALANVFCHLISSMDDISPYVAQRATLYLGTIHDTALKVSGLGHFIFWAFHNLPLGVILIAAK